MNVNMNVYMNEMVNTTSKKQEVSNASKKSEDFKSVLDKHEQKATNSSNENALKKSNNEDNSELNVKEIKSVEDTVVNPIEDTVAKVEKIIEGSKSDIKPVEDTVVNLIEDAVAKLQKTIEGSEIDIKPVEDTVAKLEKTIEGSESDIGASDESMQQIQQLQQLLQSLVAMFQNSQSDSGAVNSEVEATSIKLGNGMETEILTPDVKVTLKNNLSEMIAILEKSKEANLSSSEITDMMQKLNTLVEDLKKDFSVGNNRILQSISSNSEDVAIKNNLLKKIVEQSTKPITGNVSKDQMQSSNESSKQSEFSGSSSKQEKFLNSLISGDKDETKITKAVNFMNQFETVKNIDTAKVQTINTTIDKSNFTVDIIKDIKFMEINNIKDLSVKMNPKELGEITIKLTMESGIMKASISAQNKDTFNLLNQNFQDISDKLKNMDIKIQSLDINIYEDSTFFNKDSNGKSNSGSKNNKQETTSGAVEEDNTISHNYTEEENQVNKFV